MKYQLQPLLIISKLIPVLFDVLPDTGVNVGYV